MRSPADMDLARSNSLRNLGVRDHDEGEPPRSGGFWYLMGYFSDWRSDRTASPISNPDFESMVTLIATISDPITVPESVKRGYLDEW